MPVKIIAKEDGCPNSEMCFEIAEGSFPTIHTGEKLEIVLENQGKSPHNLHVTTKDKADGSHESTPADEAIGYVEAVAPGQTGRTSLAIPDAETLYLWCSIEGHEASGMWMEVPVEDPSEQAER